MLPGLRGFSAANIFNVVWEEETVLPLWPQRSWANSEHPVGAHSEQPAPEVWEGLFPLHTTLKRDVERDAAVSGTKSPLFQPKVHFFHTSGTETPLFQPVLEHHIPHRVLNTGVLLGGIGCYVSKNSCEGFWGKSIPSSVLKYYRNGKPLSYRFISIYCRLPFWRLPDE